MPLLGVNIDHVATLRQARRTYEPDPVWAAAAAELGGADGITIHLREDRRHILDRDLRVLSETVTVQLNLEMAATEEMVAIACKAKPDQVTLVPESREEITTEGGLDIASAPQKYAPAIEQLKETGAVVALFLDPDPKQIDAAIELGVDAVELHTGAYGLADGAAREQCLAELAIAGREIRQGGLLLHAGHGLNYQNVKPVAALEGMRELNIGHSIVSRAIFTGLERAVREMKQLL